MKEASQTSDHVKYSPLISIFRKGSSIGAKYWLK